LRAAARPIREGIACPQFAGEKLANLIGLLRIASATTPSGPAPGH
jgi:hypothetical protein